MGDAGTGGQETVPASPHLPSPFLHFLGSVAREVLKREPARHGIHKMLTVPPPPTSPERRLPLRQQPSERSFSASPRNADLVRNDRVFPHFKGLISKIPNLPTAHTRNCFTGICHSGGDVFCLFASNSGDLTSHNQDESPPRKLFFQPL